MQREGSKKEELLRQLKALAEELTNAEQTSAAAKQYNEKAAFLASPLVLKHKDKGVRLYAACCLVDILRVYAPDAPFDKDQMWDVFSLIISQLRALEHGPKGTNYKKHFYILESLALVRTFNICTEYDFQDLILELFKLLFSVVNDSHTVKEQTFMVEIMGHIFEDSESISQELLDTVLINIIEPQKSENPAAYKVASNVIKKSSTNIEPFIQMFFNSVLTLGKTSESDLAEKVYELILELNRISCPVLLSVLPQLEFKLKSPDVEERLAVTKLLAQMFSDPASDLATENKSLWNCYIGRYHDINVDVRIECVKEAKHFLLHHQELAQDITEKLCSRSRDPDERVRQEVVTVTCEAAVENIKCISDTLFDEVCERMRDKKWHVRREALTCLGKLYKKCTTGPTADPQASKKLSWLPSKLLKGYYQNMVEDRLCVERVLSGCLVPVSLQTQERMKRLMSVYTKLDHHAVEAFNILLKCQSNVRADLAALVELSEKEKTEENNSLMMSHVITLARALPEPFKAQENLKKLQSMLVEAKTRDLFKICINPDSGCPAVFKAVSDIVVKLGSRNHILETVKALLDRAAPVMVDASCVKVLLSIVKNIIEGLGEEDDEFDEQDDSDTTKVIKGMKLLVVLSGIFPSHFKNTECYETLLVLLKHQDQEIVNYALHILSNVGEGMESVDKEVVQYYQPVLSKFACKGTPQQVKYAMKSISKIFKDPTSLFERIFARVLENLDYDYPLLLSHLTALAQIAVLAPSIFETKQKAIIRDFVVKELLVKDRSTVEESDSQGDEEWCDDCDVTRETQAKVKGIKLMVRWLQGLQGNHMNSALPVLRLLCTLLAHGGDLQNNGCVCSHDCSRLRLAAACGILKIAQELHYDEVIALEHFQQLALTLQDFCVEVRNTFTKKLQKALESLKLPLEYLGIFALAASETDKDRKAKIRQMISRNVTIRREYLKHHSAAQACSHSLLPEYALPAVIHLLAHHPDFKPKEHDSLVKFKDYLWFFMEPILSNKTENAGLLKKIVETIKQTKDAQNPDDQDANEALYTVCDLTYGLIINKASGLVMEEFPGNPVLPKKMFLPGKMDVPNTKSYLPPGFVFFHGKQRKAVPSESAKLSTSNNKGKKTAEPKSKKTATKGSVKNSKKTFKEMANKIDVDDDDSISEATDDTVESGPDKNTRKRSRTATSTQQKPQTKKSKLTEEETGSEKAESTVSGEDDDSGPVEDQPEITKKTETSNAVKTNEKKKPSKTPSSPAPGTRSSRRLAGKDKEESIPATDTTSRGKTVPSPVKQSPRKDSTNKTASSRSSPRKNQKPSHNKRSPFKMDSPIKTTKTIMKIPKRLKSELDTLPEDEPSDSDSEILKTPLASRRTKRKPEVNGISSPSKKRKTQEPKPSPSKKQKTLVASPSKKPKNVTKSPSKKQSSPSKKRTSPVSSPAKKRTTQVSSPSKKRTTPASSPSKKRTTPASSPAKKPTQHAALNVKRKSTRRR
ncbi:sister chromatid cohesion protein PDS5 homolog A-like isoform X2 [Actinia tenebrosa]|uniref:Sister chromatid cohesion protein PDS5 homolog A-like isoform X2 n=1 Tax=Actinia tenebrosa TaxID=6105 RepID=A0A6P8H1T6_ACTTE|nr:sister chromatid cohesion protein PDS5 homolog A-like isoform X2 [Actinia tenebrosa]